MMLEMRVYIEKRDKTREIEQPDAWFTPPIDYDELEERIGVTDQEPDYVIRDYELPFEIDEDMMIEELSCLCQLVEYLPESVQNNTGALLKEYGSVENVYKHFAKNQNPVL